MIAALRWTLFLGLACGPVLAQDILPRADVPVGCLSTETVQFRGCSVSHYYVCEQAPGHVFEVHVNGRGSMSLTQLDDELNMVLYAEPAERLIIRPDGTQKDPLSFTELMETGRDSYSEVQIINDDMRIEIEGFDSLSGASVVIDGRSLLITDFAYTMKSAAGDLMAKVSGQQFADPARRHIYQGIFIDHLDEAGTVDNSPVDFIAEGEPGFGDLKPLYDCKATT